MYLKDILLRVSGAVVALVAALALLHSVRAARAQGLYAAIRFKPDAALFARAEKAYRLYPRDFRLCAHAAVEGYARLYAASEPADRIKWHAEAMKWGERGLRLNPYMRKLNLVKTRLLESTSPARALEFWRVYVEWHYWNRYNHSVLAELCAVNGRFEDALGELDMARGGPGYKHARKRVMELWRGEAGGVAPGGGIAEPDGA